MRRSLFSARLRYRLFVAGQLMAVMGVALSIIQHTLVGAVGCAVALAIFTNALLRIRCTRCDRRLLVHEGRWSVQLPARCRACGRSTAGMPQQRTVSPAYDLGRRRNYLKE